MVLTVGEGVHAVPGGSLPCMRSATVFSGCSKYVFIGAVRSTRVVTLNSLTIGYPFGVNSLCET